MHRQAAIIRADAFFIQTNPWQVRVRGGSIFDAIMGR
jgi:hypothetical protein